MLRNRPLKNYHIYGEHNKDTIVFIHGLNDDHRCWKKQIPFFSKYYKCIVVDRTSVSDYLNFEDIYYIIKNNKTNGNLYCLCASYGCDAAWDIQQKELEEKASVEKDQVSEPVPEPVIEEVIIRNNTIFYTIHHNVHLN